MGKGWFLYEIAYALLGLLVLAVIGAAAGEIVAEHLGLDTSAGTVSLMVLIGVLVFWGTRLIEKVLAGWSFVLYITYGIFVLFYLIEHGGNLGSALGADKLDGNWIMGSVQYIGYSMSVVPIILFCVQHMESRRDAITAGLLSGPIAMLPAFLFYIAMASSYPDILEAPVPADHMMQQLDMPLLKAIFYVVIFGTFVETRDRLHPCGKRANRRGVPGKAASYAAMAAAGRRTRGTFGFDRVGGQARTDRPHRQRLRHADLGISAALRAAAVHRRCLSHPVCIRLFDGLNRPDTPVEVLQQGAHVVHDGLKLSRG